MGSYAVETATLLKLGASDLSWPMLTFHVEMSGLTLSDCKYRFDGGGAADTGT